MPPQRPHFPLIRREIAGIRVSELAREFGTPKAPTIREFKEGDRVITKRWEPSTRSWVKVGEAPRSSPTKATMADRKLALSSKYRAAQEGRAQWTEADQAEWDMLIQADPMDILRRNIIRGMGRDPAAPTPSPDSGVTPPAASTEGPGFWENPYGYFFGSSADAGQPTPGGNGATPPAAPQQRRGRYPRPGRPGPGQPSPSVPIESMTEDQITALVYGGRELSEGDLARIDARLKALGR